MINCTFEKGYKASLRHVVVHALCVKDGSILLAKRAGDILESGKWCLPGGFMDRDETAAQAALRELKEETGITGEIITLFRINSKPDRPKEDRQNVAFDFIIRFISSDNKHDHETSELKWFRFNSIPDVKDLAFDHGDSIRLYLEYLKNPRQLPILD